MGSGGGAEDDLALWGDASLVVGDLDDSSLDVGAFNTLLDLADIKGGDGVGGGFPEDARNVPPGAAPPVESVRSARQVPVAAMMLTPEPRETSSSIRMSRPRSIVVTSMMVRTPSARAIFRSLMPRSIMASRGMNSG